MGLENDGDRGLPFRSDALRPEEPAPWDPPSPMSRLVAAAVWIFAGGTMVVLAVVAGAFFYLVAVSGKVDDAIQPDSPEGRLLLAESVELEGCRYVERVSEEVTVHFTNRFDERLDQVVIEVMFTDGGQLVAERQISHLEIAPGESRTTLVQADKAAISESDSIECSVDWIRVFETG